MNVDGIQAKSASDLFHDRRKRMGGGAEMKRKAIECVAPKKPAGKRTHSHATGVGENSDPKYLSGEGTAGAVLYQL